MTSKAVCMANFDCLVHWMENILETSKPLVYVFEGHVLALARSQLSLLPPITVFAWSQAGIKHRSCWCWTEALKL